jgi:hypothetical protein
MGAVVDMAKKGNPTDINNKITNPKTGFTAMLEVKLLGMAMGSTINTNKKRPK